MDQRSNQILSKLQLLGPAVVLLKMAVSLISTIRRDGPAVGMWMIVSSVPYTTKEVEVKTRD